MNIYLQQRTLFAPQIWKRPSLNLGLVVVIPAYKETFLLLTLMNLHKCKLPDGDVEVIVVVNDSETDSEEVKALNRKVVAQAKTWAKKHSRPRLKFYILYHGDLGKKHAGVGLARKIGMDEACWRFEKMKKKNGIIACLDADSRIALNYFCALEEHFKERPKSPACSIYFEHPLCGPDFEPSIYEAAMLYELHLRYYIQIQKWIRFPKAYHTVGSSMAVRSKAYQSKGGMNKRKAGEDFYFLHKFTDSNYFSELNSTIVIPSPRPSDRVPFGTGRAIGNMVKQNPTYSTYSPQSFWDLWQLFKIVPDLYALSNAEWQELSRGLPTSVLEFLSQNKFEEKWAEIQRNTSNRSAFKKRFFQWFDAFLLMKFVHFCRDHYYPDVEVKTAANWFLQLRKDKPKNKIVQPTEAEKLELKALLIQFRNLDRALATQSM